MSASRSCLAGGNLTHGELLRRLLTIRLEEVAPHAEIVTPYLDAAVGAALLALKQAWKERERRLGDWEIRDWRLTILREL